MDAPAMVSFVTRNREHLAPYEPLRDAEYFTERFWAAHLQRSLARVEAGHDLPFILLDRDTPRSAIVGRCTFSEIVRGSFQAAYLGYSLDASHVGRGLMQEALSAAIAYAFDVLNLHRIMANHVPTNARSAQLLQRLGFQHEGVAKAYLRLAGEWRDHVLTALTNPRWRSGPPEDAP
jgi:ribosomal-protein-alanine N-acetyltransferase